MQLETLIRKTLDVKDHRVAAVEGDTQHLEITLNRIRRRRLPCSICGRRAKVYDTLRVRRWRHVALWGIPATLICAPRRVECPVCGVKEEEIPWSFGKSPLSRPLLIQLATWSRLLALSTVGQLFRCSTAAVTRAVQYAVAYGLQNRELGELLYLGIDEIARGQGQNYQTMVYDLVSKRLLHCAQGRSADSLRAFFRELGPARCAALEGICVDMWEPYVKVIKEFCPQAILVFDKFHLVRHLLEAVDKVRREEVRKLAKTQPKLLVGTKYMWLKNPWNLTRQQSVGLAALLTLNLGINRAYLLKEAFRHFWNYRSRTWAEKYLRQWCWWATHSRLKPLRDFAWMLKRHWYNILTYFDVRVNNGITEALNNVAKKVIRRAHGFRTVKWLTAILFHTMGQLPLPDFTHRFW